MEELVLTEPDVIPEKVTNKYHVISLTLDMTTVALDGEPGLIGIILRDNNGERFTHSYVGKQAMDLIKFLNTANLTTKSMHKRVLEKLSADGVLPGSVTGAPDVVAMDDNG
jgi:hypothetical protein